MIDQRTGVERYPSNDITYLYNGNTYSFTCNDMVPSLDDGKQYFSKKKENSLKFH